MTAPIPFPAPVTTAQLMIFSSCTCSSRRGGISGTVEQDGVRAEVVAPGVRVLGGRPVGIATHAVAEQFAHHQGHRAEDLVGWIVPLLGRRPAVELHADAGVHPATEGVSPRR